MMQVHGMRGFLRLVASGASVIFLALLVLTTETAADELGFVSKVRAFVRGGWQAVADSGYVMAVHAGFWLSLGVAATLWTDHFIRRARRTPMGRSMVSFDLLAEEHRKLFDDFGVYHASVVETKIGTYVLDMLFEENMPLYITAIAGDGDFNWQELIRTDRWLRVEVTPHPGAKVTALSVIARPFEKGDENHVRQEQEWQVGYLMSRFSTLHARGVSRPLQWR